MATPHVHLVRSNEPRTRENLQPHHFVHQRALTILAAELASRVENERVNFEANVAKRLLKHRVHEAILVYGSRGSGKTTFMVDFLNLVEGAKSKNVDPPLKSRLAQIDEHCEILGILDPTLLSQPKNLIVLLVGLVRETVVDHLRGVSIDNSSRYNNWHSSLRKLASSIDGADVGRESGSDDGFRSSEEIMEMGLRRMSEGHSLEQNFHRFVHESLNILNKRAFIVVLDDIDTQFNVGWHVLETIRKYCTTPAFICIVLGDLELYTMRVRSEQLEILGENLREDELRRKAKNDSDNSIPAELDYDRMVEDLQSQYLIKVLPPRLRIRLPNLDQATRSGEIICKVVYSMNAELTGEVDGEVRATFKEILEREGRFLSPQTRGEIVRLLLAQPLRTVVNLLPTRNSLHSDQDYTFPERLTHTLADALIEGGVHPSTIEKDSEALVVACIKFMNRYYLWSSGVGLQLRGGSESIALASTVLSAWMNFHLQRSGSLILDYLLRFAGSQASESIRPGFVHWAGLKSLDDPISGKLIAWRHWNDAKRNVAIGGIGLGESQSKIEQMSNQLIRFQLEEFFRLPLIRTQDHSTYLSVFPILEFIGSVFQPELTFPQRLRVFNEKKDYPIKQLDFQRYNRSEEQKIESDSNLEVEDDPGYSRHFLERPLEEWAERWRKFEGFVTIDQEVLWRVWHRFETALSNISDSASKRQPGYELHLQCVAFFNSILLEERRDLGPLFRARNVKTSDTVFDQNYRRLLKLIAKTGEPETLLGAQRFFVHKGVGSSTTHDFEDRVHDRIAGMFPLFAFVTSCPIWLLYLEQKHPESSFGQPSEAFQMVAKLSLTQNKDRSLLDHENSTLYSHYNSLKRRTR